MRECEYVRQISAYCDGELPAEEIRRLEEHIRQCPSCTQELEQLKALSGLIGAVAVPELSPIALKRLHRAIVILPERTIVRTAEVFAAVAAAVLLVCSVWLSQMAAAQEGQSGLGADWERIAMEPQPANIVAADTGEQLAQWIIQGISEENTND